MRLRSVWNGLPRVVQARALSHTPAPPPSPPTLPVAAPTSAPPSLLYSSRPPALVLGLVRVLAANAAASGAAALSLLAQYAGAPTSAVADAVSPTLSALAGMGINGPLLSMIAAVAAVDPLVRGAALLGTVGGVSGWFAATLLRRTVVRLEVVEGPPPRLRISRPSFWGGGRTVDAVYPASAVSCNPSGSTMQGFLLSAGAPGSWGAGRQTPRYLFPLHDAVSGDLGRLKTIMYGDYFRAGETGPPADEALIAIAGFGPYRPAQFADPRCAAVGGLEGLRTPAGLLAPGPIPGTPYVLDGADGGVWGEFVLPAKRAFQERRADEADAKLYGKGKRDVAKTAGPVTLRVGG